MILYLEQMKKEMHL